MPFLRSALRSLRVVVFFAAVHAGASAQQPGEAQRPPLTPERPGRETEAPTRTRPDETPTPESEKKEPRRGIPIRDEVIVKNCGVCHKVDADQQMSRVSFMRKAPEGWELSVKRMIRHHDLRMPPEEARQIVASLSNSHGLARDEAKRALYDAERRVHWSEADQDKDLRQTCGACHTLGRVFSQQRDVEEWKNLKAMHLAFFPLTDTQAFRGREQEAPQGGRNFDEMTEAEIEAEMQRRREAPRGPDRADRILGELSKRQTLFTKEWDEWQVERREVPIEGTWSVVGHATGRGDVRGEVVIRKVGPDTFETEWRQQSNGGAPTTRKGRGLLYAGYSWRGRSELTAGGDPDEPKLTKEVLLLSADWQTMEGRIFHGEFAEFGADITLHRQDGIHKILALDGGSVLVPGKDQGFEIFGHSFPEGLSASDFHCGSGVTVTKAEWISSSRVRVRVDVQAGAEQGRRQISFRSNPGPKVLVLYDTIDTLKIEPEEGFSRVGSAKIPKHFERFEAWGMNRGKDDKPGTEDDFRVRVVPSTWSLEEFPSHEGDDDLQFVGVIDPTRGLFTPGTDGPNPARKWLANNIGDVYVVATCTLTVPVVPPKPKPKPKEPETDPKAGAGSGEPKGEGEKPIEPKVEPPPPVQTTPTLITKEFRARGHLLVTVPIYVFWDRYTWDQR